MRYCIVITGRVQGVFYRKYTLECAEELGIKGFVMNRLDGSVYCEAECADEMKMQMFLDYCGLGSPHSRVDSVDVSMAPPIGFKEFEIRK